jgi:hypothetical protein
LQAASPKEKKDFSEQLSASEYDDFSNTTSESKPIPSRTRKPRKSLSPIMSNSSEGEYMEPPKTLSPPDDDEYRAIDALKQGQQRKPGHHKLRDHRE